MRGVLRAARVVAGVSIGAAFLAATCPAWAGTAQPVRASTVASYAKRAPLAPPPPPLTIATLAADLSVVAGRTITISCEPAAGFPKGLDGYVDPAPDGSIIPTVHVLVSVCWNAERSNRTQDPAPSWFPTFGGHREDGQSGPALQVMLHETMHITLQSRNEADVECTAYRNRWAFVRLLPIPAFVAGMMLAGMADEHHATVTQFPAYSEPCS